ncbi:MAG: hypothetical protein WDM80_19220 [Limisphaerales bacterium]
MAASVLSAVAGETTEPAAATNSVARSTFKQPTSPKEGRDPFFPNSPRLFASLVIPAAESKDLSSLVIRGKSGTLDRPLVIINDVTFAVGDERDVVTPQGRIRIHCIKIIGDLAVIEAFGQRHQLRFETKP